MQSSRTLASYDFLKKGKVYDQDLTAGGRLGIFLDSEKNLGKVKETSLIPPHSNSLGFNRYLI